MLAVADKGGGVEALLTSTKIRKIWQNCFKSSVLITMRETTALKYSPKPMTTFSFKLDKINI